MEGLLCQVPKKDKQDTFALLDEWLPAFRTLDQEEALATLADRYIKSRGPATEYDFANWAGMKVSDARKGLEMVSRQVERKTVDGVSYWFSATGKDVVAASTDPQAWLLPAFDEMLCGYKDRSALLESAEMKSIILKNGIFKPLMVLENQAVGTWQRTIKTKQVVVSLSFFRELSIKKKQVIIDKAKSLEGFFEREVVLVH